MFKHTSIIISFSADDFVRESSQTLPFWAKISLHFKHCTNTCMFRSEIKKSYRPFSNFTALWLSFHSALIQRWNKCTSKTWLKGVHRFMRVSDKPFKSLEFIYIGLIIWLSFFTTINVFRQFAHAHTSQRTVLTLLSKKT